MTRINKFYYAEVKGNVYHFLSLKERNEFVKAQGKAITQKEMFVKLQVKNIRELNENYSIDIGIENHPFFVKK